MCNNNECSNCCGNCCKQETIVDFGKALAKVKTGKGMRLGHWSPEVIVRVAYPDETSTMTAPYLYVTSRFGNVPWNPTQIELLSDSWEVVD